MCKCFCEVVFFCFQLFVELIGQFEVIECILEGVEVWWFIVEFDDFVIFSSEFLYCFVYEMCDVFLNYGVVKIF